LSDDPSYGSGMVILISAMGMGMGGGAGAGAGWVSSWSCRISFWACRAQTVSVSCWTCASKAAKSTAGRAGSGCVTAITQEAARIKPGLIRAQTSLQEGTNHNSRNKQVEQNNSSSIEIDAIKAGMMGKLCRRALVLIKHKVGTDVSIDEHMVRVLEAWLQNRGITIYTETFL
jgi:hypothetical protein